MFASPTLSSSLCLLFWSALALFVLLEPCLSTTEQEQFPAAVLDEAIMAQPEAAAKLCQQFPGLDACQSQMMEKRKSAYMRFGKRSPSLAMPLDIAEAEEQPTMEKRKSAYMRFGKRSSSPAFFTEMEPTMEKRKSAYMRFGKRKSAYMRFGRK